MRLPPLANPCTVHVVLTGMSSAHAWSTSSPYSLSMIWYWCTMYVWHRILKADLVSRVEASAATMWWWIMIWHLAHFSWNLARGLERRSYLCIYLLEINIGPWRSCVAGSQRDRSIPLGLGWAAKINTTRPTPIHWTKQTRNCPTEKQKKKCGEKSFM